MPNPKIIACYSLKDNCGFLVMASILTMPTCRTLFPPLMHTIDTINHGGKPSFFCFLKEPSNIFSIGWPKIGLPIEINHCPSEVNQALKDGGLPHTKALIKAVCRTSICKHTQGSSYLLYSGEPRKACSIGFPLEVDVPRSNNMTNVNEHSFAHLKVVDRRTCQRIEIFTLISSKE
jgi:hypothetical protein